MRVRGDEMGQVCVKSRAAAAHGGRGPAATLAMVLAVVLTAAAALAPAPVRAQAAPAAGTPAQAAPAPAAEDLKIATRIVAPFVNRESDGTLTGFSVDLWRAIAAEAGLRSTFQEYGPLPDLLNAVRDGTNPAGIAAISITSSREQYLDFSQPMFRAGLAIMVPEAEDSPLAQIASIFSAGALKVLGLYLLALLIPAHLIWLTQRGRVEHGSLGVSRRYFPGIFQAMFWSAEAMVGQAELPKAWASRVISLIWIYAGVILIAYFTALAATTLTLSSLRGDINGPGDLVGRSVATVRGSTSARFLQEIKASPVEFDTFDEAVKALGDRDALAVVYDAPVLLYYASNAGAGKVRVVGEPFRIENYGIIFPTGSDLRRPVNAALLRLVENGTYQSIYDKWFAKKKAE